MRFLVVMSRSPFPPETGSAIVAFNTIKHLSKHHTIDFMCLQPTDGLVELPNFVNKAEFVCQRQATNFVKLFHKTLGMLAGVPPSISACMSKDMRVRVQEVIEHVEFDAILLFEIHAIQYCPPFSYNKMIVNIEDPQSIKLSRMVVLPVWSFLQKLKLLFKKKITESYERRVLGKIMKVLMLSAADMRDMEELGGYDNLGVVSYGINTVSIENVLSYEVRNEGMIIFSGNMFHPPNVDGALYFLQQIFPLVLQGYSTAKLWIVGSDPDIRIRDAAVCFEEHVVITGRVINMAENLQSARVCICPVRLKIGVQTKILEALSWGTPVVTTSAGNSGIGGSSGSQLWVEDEPYRFASRVVELLRGEGWSRLSEQGKKLADKHFSWENSTEQLNKHIQSLILKNQ
jgi:glycosyltransferase involved in cell wall biosynthesis